MREAKHLLLSLLSLLSLIGTPAIAGDPGPLVAAASSLRDALPKLVDAFAAQSGTSVRLSFGASGNLRRQIAQGAPFELFLSADEALVLDLVREGKTLDAGAVYAKGRLAILVPKGSAMKPDGSLVDLGEAMDDGRLRRVAIANPQHAPYGRAAREALMAVGLWKRLADRLVVGESASQAAQFVATGGADAGLVAYSLTLSPRLSRCCEHAPLPAKLHQPLRQRGVLLKGAGAAAEHLFAFILQPQGRAVLQRHGFGLPDED